MATVYISLGSNQGDRQANLRAAAERLEAVGVRIARSSALYETEPREFLDQPWFLNQVVEAETALFPPRLLDRMLQIEREMGRERTVPKGPRIIDLDILSYSNWVVRTPDLDIPHPRIAERRFVLEPLTEISPDLRLPGSGISIGEMLHSVLDQTVRRI